MAEVALISVAQVIYVNAIRHVADITAHSAVRPQALQYRRR